MSETSNREQRAERLSRQTLLLGEESDGILARARVALFGVGGVGSYAAEALARCGVGQIDLIDSDCVSVSNINRQLCALTSTVGRPKVEVVAQRLRDINPELKVTPRQEFFLPETADSFDFAAYDFVIDAIDTVTAKVAIATLCHTAGVPMLSCMGTGNKQDPTALRVGDLAKTHTCPLARVMRRELKARGILHLPVVWSEEPPMTPMAQAFSESGKAVPGSLAFVPSVAGLIAAGEAVKTILKNAREKEKHE